MYQRCYGKTWLCAVNMSPVNQAVPDKVDQKNQLFLCPEFLVCSLVLSLALLLRVCLCGGQRGGKSLEIKKHVTLDRTL